MHPNFKISNVGFLRIHFKHSFKQRSKKENKYDDGDDDDDKMIRAQWPVIIDQK